MVAEQRFVKSQKNGLPNAKNSKKGEEFSAEEFVERLLREGAATPCDETNESFRESTGQPYFYDEEKFKRGRQLYHRYIHKMFLSMLMGFLSIIAIPSIASVLEYTKMSSTPLTAYKRYIATMFHVVIWYDEGFKPSSKLWKSIEEVRGKHSFASKRCCTNGLKKISQLDMSLTLFGFMGYQLSRPKFLGMEGTKDEDYEGFVHIWKVIGHMMGIDERFNICRDSVAETRAICDVIIRKVFKPRVLQETPTSVMLTKAFVEGMWCLSPFIGHNIVMVLLYELMNSPGEDLWKSPEFLKRYGRMTYSERLGYWYMRVQTYLYRFAVFRYYQNFSMYTMIWLMHNFPILAILKFGKDESFVRRVGEV